jgi:hypothetical protein
MASPNEDKSLWCAAFIVFELEASSRFVQPRGAPDQPLIFMSHENNRPYEPIVHMFTIFFYVLMSLGLKEILAGEVFEPETQRWPCFIAAFLLLLRFLFGSASHLSIEPEREESVERRILRWHLGCLIVFALIGTRICFSEDVPDFLRWNIRFGVVAAAAAVVGGIRFEREALRKDFRNCWAPKWTVFNGIQAITSYIALIWYQAPGAGTFIAGWSMPLCFLIVMFALILWRDLRFQIHKLYSATKKLAHDSDERARQGVDRI